MKVKEKLIDHKWILLIMLGLFLERMLFMSELGIGYGPSTGTDNVGYLNSGIEFANSGMISIYVPYPTAMIMPGITVVLGALSFLFGEGLAYMLSAKILWAVLGSLTAWYTYRSVELFLPRKYALLAACVFFLPNYAWMNNIILTETPFILCFNAAIYYTLALGKGMDKKLFIKYTIAVFVGTMFRISIIVFPAFTAFYLFILKGQNFWMLLRRFLALALVFLVFLVPWTIRNYHHFESFIPVTYGAGNANMLGTYQGFGYPEDDELDYETNVEQVYRTKYAHLLDENGYPKNHKLTQYLSLEKDALKADYRLQVWWENNPLSLLFSYFVYKPLILVVNVFYYEFVFGITKTPLLLLRGIDLLLCCLSILFTIREKEHRREIWFLTILYWMYIYVSATSYATIRYAEPLMCFRYIIAVIGLARLVSLLKNRKKTETVSA